MEFARKVWKLLVAIKDGLVLLFMLLFFMALYAALSMSPHPGKVVDGALLIELSGMVVEEPSVPDPLSALLSGEAPLGEYRARDIARALRMAATDDRIKAVVLDLSGLTGGGYVSMHEVGEAIDAVRAANKPVLTYAVAYLDDGMQLAGHASEVWVDPMGGAFITGPGGNHFYYARLLEKLKIKANVFRVGTFKSAVEPFVRNEPSPEAQEAYEAVYGTIWDAWKAEYAKARPKTDIAGITGDPVGWLEGAGGDVVEAGKKAGLIDRIGTRTEFGMRVAELVGKDEMEGTAGAFVHTDLDAWLAANPEEQKGQAIGVVTIAGEIVDGDAGPGLAGGDRITALLDEALERDYAALVVRVDSPGGSVVASEQVRRAIMRFKDKGIPVVASMANVAASGGYWVSTPAQRIFAEPATVTGSIGVFAVVPTFDKALAEIGVTGGGVKTTPLSGQPDTIGGLAPEVYPMIQLSIENIYRDFLGVVRQSRGKSLARPVEDWAEGRPWSGGDARQLGLVDEFGSLDDALAYAAKSAGLEGKDWHPEFLGGEPDSLTAFLGNLGGGKAAAPSARGADLAGIAAARQASMIDRAIADAGRLAGTRGVQAYCLECPAVSAVPASAKARSVWWRQALGGVLGGFERP